MLLALDLYPSFTHCAPPESCPLVQRDPGPCREVLLIFCLKKCSFGKTGLAKPIYEPGLPRSMRMEGEDWSRSGPRPTFSPRLSVSPPSSSQEPCYQQQMGPPGRPMPARETNPTQLRASPQEESILSQSDLRHGMNEVRPSQQWNRERGPILGLKDRPYYYLKLP